MLEKLKELIGGAHLTGAAAAKKQPYTGKYPDISKIKRGYFKKGDKGAEITKLQNYLNWYTDGEFFKKCGKADGTFGANTDKYVKKMQTKFFSKAEADGTVGKKTIAKMKAYSDSFKPGPKPEPTPTNPMPTAIFSDFVSSPAKMGQACGSETGGHSGKAGDQTNKELLVCNYSYSESASSPYHWENVFRAKDTKARLVIADQCIKACNNPHVGYDTSDPDRKTLYKEAKKKNWQIDKITKDCETTCSELANVCMACAGLKHLPVTKNAYVDTLRSFLKSDTEVTKITLKTKTLQPGDILVSDGHVAMIVGSPIYKGESSKRVKDLQKYLDWYFDGKFVQEHGAIDTKYDDVMFKYVKKMQTNFFGAKEADGIVGPKTLKKMKAVKK